MPMSSEGQSFSEVVGRLDEIVEAVRSKDASLERSLDLLDEAIALGSRALELVDAADVSPEELAQADAAPADAAQVADGPTPAPATGTPGDTHTGSDAIS